MKETQIDPFYHPLASEVFVCFLLLWFFAAITKFPNLPWDTCPLFTSDLPDHAFVQQAEM